MVDTTGDGFGGDRVPPGDERGLGGYPAQGESGSQARAHPATAAHPVGGGQSIDPGAYPGGAYGTSGPAPEVVEPTTVRNAVLAWGAYVLLSLASIVYGTLTVETSIADGVARVAETNPAADPALMEVGARAGAYGALVAGFVVTVFMAFLAWKMRQGRNWARITLTVIGGLQAVASPFALTLGGLSPLQMLVQAVMTVALLAGLVLMWLRPSSDFFTAHRSVALRG